MRKIQFKDLATIPNGQVSPLEEPYAGMMHIGPENIGSGTGKLSGLKTASALGLQSGKYLFDSSCLVYSKVRPNLNKVCRPDFPGICSADAYPIRPRTDVVTKDFLFYSMQGREFLKQATAVAMRTGMPKINRDDLGLIWLSVPDIVEQARITAALDDWSSIQYSMDCLLDAKRRFKKALAQQLLTGKRRFPTASQEWRHPRTDEVFENVSRKNHGGDIVLSVTQDAGVVPRESLERKINMTAENTHTYKLVEPGDFVISLRSFQGGLEYSDHRGLVSPAYQVIRPKVDVIPTFYRHYFKSAEFIKRLAVAIIGIRDGKQISCGDFSFMRIPFPPANEQRRIADTLDAVDREIDILTRQVEALRRQKQGLMQQLLTGRARIPGGGE